MRGADSDSAGVESSGAGGNLRNVSEFVSRLGFLVRAFWAVYRIYCSVPFRLTGPRERFQ